MILKTLILPFDIKIARVSKQPAKQASKKPISTIINKDYDKVFCIGHGKTGTTSLGKLLENFGFTLGNQAVAEVLAEDFMVQKRVDRILNYCYTADAFQDAPFMFPGIYEELDKAFPGSKFILSVRDSPDQWYNSLVKFHTKIFSSDKNRPPDETDAKNALYRYKGWLYDVLKYYWRYPEIPLYDEMLYKQLYINHNSRVENYFDGRSDAFIKINLSKIEDFNKLCAFLNVKTGIQNFPWENKT